MTSSMAGLMEFVFYACKLVNSKASNCKIIKPKILQDSQDATWFYVLLKILHRQISQKL